VSSKHDPVGEVRIAYLKRSEATEQAWSGAEATRSVVDGRHQELSIDEERRHGSGVNSTI
jgi:hypothetical protein